jgi:hypothetical protein
VISYRYRWKYRYLGFHRHMAPCGRKLRSQGESVWMSRDIRPKAVSRLRRELAASRSATSISDRLGVTSYSFYLEGLFGQLQIAQPSLSLIQLTNALRRNNWYRRSTSYCSIHGGIDWALTGYLVPRLIPDRCIGGARSFSVQTHR